MLVHELDKRSRKQAIAVSTRTWTGTVSGVTATGYNVVLLAGTNLYNVPGPAGLKRNDPVSGTSDAGIYQIIGKTKKVETVIEEEAI